MGSQITCLPMSLFEIARRGIFQKTKKEAIWEEEYFAEIAATASVAEVVEKYDDKSLRFRQK